MKRTEVYGIMAEFDSVHTLLDAANRTREAGYKKIDAYSPFPDRRSGGSDRIPSRRSSAGGADRRHCSAA